MRYIDKLLAEDEFYRVHHLTLFIEVYRGRDEYLLCDCAERLRGYDSILRLVISRILTLPCLMYVLELLLTWCDEAHDETEVNLIKSILSIGIYHVETYIEQRPDHIAIRLLYAIGTYIDIGNNFIQNYIKKMGASVPILKLCEHCCFGLWNRIMDNMELVIHYSQVMNLLQEKMPLNINAFHSKVELPWPERIRLFHRAGSPHPSVTIMKRCEFNIDLIRLCIDLWKIPLDSLHGLVSEYCDSSYRKSLIEMGIQPTVVGAKTRAVYISMNLEELDTLEYTWQIPRDIIGMVKAYC
jgi:hypothetical protein